MYIGVIMTLESLVVVPPPSFWRSSFSVCLYRVPPPKKKHTQNKQTNGTIDFSGLCSDQQLSFFTLLDRASFPHCNNTKIIKFG